MEEGEREREFFDPVLGNAMKNLINPEPKECVIKLRAVKILPETPREPRLIKMFIFFFYYYYFLFFSNKYKSAFFHRFDFPVFLYRVGRTRVVQKSETVPLSNGTEIRGNAMRRDCRFRVPGILISRCRKKQELL